MPQMLGRCYTHDLIPDLVAVGALGVAGTVVAVMLDEEEDTGPVPVVFVPLTVKVYAVAD
jgi:hypothetical protein